MEEVDSIILHFLKQLDIKISDEIKNLCDLPVEAIIESASKCLSVIHPGQKLPPRLPSGISHRIEVAAQIASICKDLGYKNDVGYQTFLYYNESELRQVFMFLIEHLPSEGTQNTTVEPASNQSLLLRSIGKKIDEELNSIWIPPSCNKNNRSYIGDFTSSPGKKSKNWANVASQFNENYLEQKLSRMNIQTKVTTEADVGKEINYETEAKTEINQSLKELKELALVLRQNLNVLESERNIMDVEYQQANQSFEKVETELKYVQGILKNIGIENINSDIVGDNILEKVQQNIEKLHTKSEELTSKNLALRVEIDKYRSSNPSSQSERTRCRNTLISLKDTAKAMKEEYNNKEHQRDILKRKYEKLKGGSKRSIYTKRILEIISNVDKQNLEISKVLEDTRQIQKEINSLEGQLDRCFSIADETLFADAKKDDQAKKAYKLLALLHSECNTIVSLVNEIGALAREIVDLEDNIKAEKTKRTEDTLEKIQSDLARMQEESNKV